MATGTVEFIGAAAAPVAPWLRQLLPGIHKSSYTYLPDVAHGVPNVPPPADAGPDLIVVDASGSLCAGPGERRRSVEVVSAVRAQRPHVPILVLFVRPQARGESTLLAYLESVDAAPAEMLKAGATDYVIVDGDATEESQQLVEHRVQQLLPDRPRSLAEDPFRTPWMALYDEHTGRLDAERIASELGAKLKPLARALALPYSAVQRSPSARAYQAALRPVARMLEMLHDSLPDDGQRRAWLNRPRADLENASPLEVVLAGEVDAVVSLLEGVQLGVGG